MACQIIARICRRSDERTFRVIDLTDFCAQRWGSGAVVPNGTRIRPLPRSFGGMYGSTGYDYEAQADGQAGEEEPDWTQAVTLDATLTDGSLAWKCVAISNTALERTILSSSDVTWSAPDGYTVEDGPLQNTVGKQAISVFLSGGTSGDVIDLVAHVVFNDTSAEDFVVRVSVRDDIHEHDERCCDRHFH